MISHVMCTKMVLQLFVASCRTSRMITREIDKTS